MSNDTMWSGSTINSKQIIVYPNEYILVKTIGEYIVIGYKEGYVVYLITLRKNINL